MLVNRLVRLELGWLSKVAVVHVLHDKHMMCNGVSLSELHIDCYIRGIFVCTCVYSSDSDGV